MNPESASEVISLIRNNWKQVLRPEAPVDRWRQELQGAFPDYPIWNWTDFNYDKCHTYSIVLFPGPLDRCSCRQEEVAQLTVVGGRLIYLWAAISVVGPFYHVSAQSRELALGDQVRVDNVDPLEYPSEIARVQRFAAAQGLVELPGEVLETVLPDVQLDLKPLGQVTVYNCLFYDEDA